MTFSTKAIGKGKFFSLLSIFCCAIILEGCSGNIAMGQASASLSATSLSFSEATRGQTTASQAVTLTNNGTSVLNVSGISLSGTNAIEFAESNTCGATLAVSGTCNISVTFTPSLPGQSSAALSVADSASGSPQTVALTGQGPAITVTNVYPSSDTVGGPAFTLTVNGNNFDATSTVAWNGSARTTTYVSSTQLTTQVTAADLASVGTGYVTVIETADGGSSSAVAFPINALVSCPNTSASGITSCISNASGTPRLIINGRPTPPLMFFGNTQESTTQWHYLTDETTLASASGVHLYKLAMNIPWTGTGTPANYAADDSALNLYLNADPNAMILLEFNMHVLDYAKTLTIPAGNDNVYSDGTTAPVSLGSDAYFAAYKVAIQAAIAHYEGNPAFASRIFGYWIGGAGQTAEWFPYNYRSAGLDYSPVNLAAFRQWLSAKYQTDAALQAAWGGTVTLATAAIPVPPAGEFPIGPPGTGNPINAFYNPSTQQDWVDYSAYIGQEVTARILDLAQTVKTAVNNAKVVAFYYGYMFELPGSMTGHTDIMPLLNSSAIDILGAPISYTPITERLGGGAGGFMSAADSVALHGKLWINEDDLLTYLAVQSGLPNVGNGTSATTGFQDTYGILQRNLANVLTHRGGTYWMDLNADGAFDNAGLWNVMSQWGVPLYTDLYNNPSTYTPDVAVLVDETSVLYQQDAYDMTYYPRIQLRNLIAKTGATVGFYYLSDFINGTSPVAKAYVFANAGYLTDAEVSAIQARLTTEKSTAIWEHAPGFLGGSGTNTGAAGTSRVTGITVAESDGLPGTVGAGEFAATSWGFGAAGQNTLIPRLTVTDTSATALGHWVDGHANNTARKLLPGGYTSVLLGDFDMSNLADLRDLLSDAGAHIWISSGDVLFFDGRNVMINAGSTGTKTITLPSPYVDANTGLSTITFTIANVGDSQWFRVVHP